ncbi:FtsW/RodA/SpoVE family cell cycle protein [Paenibacillus ginsengihumi]|uniref:FtsW/RodA/SpoVE family cell cycle protein n=1 Tax=Paenibacillus ginsengihumi TaxID=431596 RepID=UPI00039B01D9|nr:FtsW/RodA/SpoVE family cell cycle protein [Paenibacillus ginsengihumi]
MMDRHPLLQDYIRDVGRQIKARELRKEITQEIAGHLDDLMDRGRQQGHDDDAAARFAIAQMGDAAAVAQGLNRVHKPRVPWGMLCCLALLAAIALIAMYAVQLSYDAGSRGAGRLFFKHAVFTTAGIMAFFIISRLPYRKLIHFSWMLYIGTLALVLATYFWGVQLNGTRTHFHLGTLLVDAQAISPYLFIISAAGMLYWHKDKAGWRTAALHTAMFSAVPMLYYMAVSSLHDLLVFAAAYALLMYVSRMGWRWLAPHALLSACLLGGYGFSRDGQRRLTGFLYPHEDPRGAGYMYLQVKDAIQSAGWLGRGFDSIVEKLPYVQADAIFTYIVYSFGWLAGLLVAGIVLFFLLQLLQSAAAVRDPYGKMLIAGLASLLAVQFIWCIGMSLGLLPISASRLPFISYGGSSLLVQWAAAGLIYGVYRRKDMIRIA